MDNLFDPRTLASLPWTPLALWQANMQIINSLQQSWVQMCMPGMAAMDSAMSGSMAAMPGLNGRWSLPESFMMGVLPFMPRIEASITPLKREGKLAGAEDASRVTMRITVPGLGGQKSSEILLVDAVVARAAGEESLRLDSADLPAAALPKKG